MRVNDICAECLYDKQMHLSDDRRYLEEVRRIIEERREEDTAPYLVYLFDKEYVRLFGKTAPYAAIKKNFNDLVLSMESLLRDKIESSDDPLGQALLYARIGNYIDFGAMNHVDEETFLGLFDNPGFSEHDRLVLDSFLLQCAAARRFLLIADNCGEIVLDRLFLEQLKKRFPDLELTVLVRGGEVLNDAVIEDAVYAGIPQIARLISSGNTVAGTVYEMLSDEAKEALDHADVILAKGQGNYESLCMQGRHVFYSFLCKCDLFTGRFGVPRLTGMLVEEKAE
ncbi:MAG: DUF89 family protein [Lachnospiraceae bacterium]|nr:DUF89 family protein [Lachnospiraceae bacterium]